MSVPWKSQAGVVEKGGGSSKNFNVVVICSWLKPIARKEGTMGLIIINTLRLALQIATLVLLVKIRKER
ncbi:hypothetical protein D7V86_25155 [bacterium D16-51]|nr:hypothetical protein D7V96_25815 [bacterium D16-59]RKI53335.1 hypothetical protein D7V86_25155 [bacterium D16-51]